MMGKVKARAIGRDQRPFLLHMVAQHLAQGLVHQVRGAVVAHGGAACSSIDPSLHRCAQTQYALLQLTVVSMHIGLDLAGVGHLKNERLGQQLPGVANLPSGLGIKRRGIEHHHARLPGCNSFTGMPSVYKASTVAAAVSWS